jgi:hypothetical protein
MPQNNPKVVKVTLAFKKSLKETLAAATLAGKPVTD